MTQLYRIHRRVGEVDGQGVAVGPEQTARDGRPLWSEHVIRSQHPLAVQHDCRQGLQAAELQHRQLRSQEGAGQSNTFVNAQPRTSGPRVVALA
eukprot:SAG31_NODE_5529_length_2475_cov_2.029040_2_plen_94_part_00